MFSYLLLEWFNKFKHLIYQMDLLCFVKWKMWTVYLLFYNILGNLYDLGSVGKVWVIQQIGGTLNVTTGYDDSLLRSGMFWSDVATINPQPLLLREYFRNILHMFVLSSAEEKADINSDLRELKIHRTTAGQTIIVKCQKLLLLLFFFTDHLESN